MRAAALNSPYHSLVSDLQTEILRCCRGERPRGPLANLLSESSLSDHLPSLFRHETTHRDYKYRELKEAAK